MNGQVDTVASAQAGSDDSGEQASPTGESDQPPEQTPGASAGGPDGPRADVPLIEWRLEDDLAGSVALDRLSRWTDRLLAELPRPVERLDVLVVGDETMRALHRRHHDLDTTTDVLTFDDSESTAGPLAVDIVVCADEAARRASQYGHDHERELLLYVLHGLLHCCGYDDHDEAAYVAMHAEEDRILERIGVGRTFATGSTSSGGASGVSEDRAGSGHDEPRGSRPAPRKSADAGNSGRDSGAGR